MSIRVLVLDENEGEEEAIFDLVGAMEWSVLQWREAMKNPA